MERYWRLAVVWTLLTGVGVGHPGLAQESEAVVRIEGAARVNVRSTPEVLRETVLTVVDRGAEFPLLDEDENWFRVLLPDGRTGWVSREFAERFDWFSVGETLPTLVEEPGDDGPAGDSVGEGERILILRREEGWAKVRGSAGAEGWIREDLLDSAIGGPPGESGEVATTFSGREVEVEEDHLEAPVAEVEREVVAAEPPPPEEPPLRAPPPPSSAAATGTDRLAWLAPHLPAVGAGVLLLAAVFAGFWVYRRRKLREIESALRLTTGVDERLKTASAGRLGAVLRQSDEQMKRIDQKLQDRFRHLRSVVEETAGPKGGEVNEGPLGKVDELREVVLRQQSQIAAMSDLLELQTEKVSALERENRLLRGLVRES